MNFTKRINRRVITLIVFLILNTIACKKSIDVEAPDNKVVSENVYASDATATASIIGIYTKLSGYGLSSPGILPNISMFAGLSADEFTLWSGTTTVSLNGYYKNILAASGTVAGSEYWTSIYPVIYSCNAAIEGMNNSTSLTPAVKQQLLGEAKFMRAFFYFYLVNMYGDVPLVLSTDYKVNAVMARTLKGQVYQQIINDLTDAQGILADGYIKSDGQTIYPISAAERVRPNKGAATALLARAYLYSGDYAKAEAQATTVIGNSYYSLPSLNNVFVKNSQEAIWQLQVTGSSGNVPDAQQFLFSYAPVGVNSSHFVYLSSSLLASFEAGDQRLTDGNWVKKYTDVTGTYYSPFKYKVANTGTNTAIEYTMMLRLGEQFLIRAEARALQNNISGAQADLNVIRNRAGLGPTTASTQAALMIAILHERQTELFTEWGHRWFDLKRTGTVDAVMTVATQTKGGTWVKTQQLYPLALLDLQKDVNLTQNAGY